MIRELTVTKSEKAVLDQIIKEVQKDSLDQSEADFSVFAPLYAHDIPRRLRRAALELPLLDGYCALLIHGNPLRQAECGPTPTHHSPRASAPLSPAELFAGLYTSLLGALYGFSSQQYGRICNSIIAVREVEEVSDSSAGSRHDFLPHTEDAFHPYPPGYIGLFCVRNHERANTRIFWLPPNALSRADALALMSTPVVMPVNAMHRDGGQRGEDRCYPILTGAPEYPYIRLNLNRTAVDTVPKKLRGVFERLTKIIYEHSKSIVLQSGDLLLIDNSHALHARDRYQPRYDAESRWLIRCVCAPDIRVTRPLRTDERGRVLSTLPSPPIV